MKTRIILLILILIGLIFAEAKVALVIGNKDYISSLSKISDEMTKLNISNVKERELRRYRQFYFTYPIAGKIFMEDSIIRASAKPELKVPDDHFLALFRSVSYSHFKELMSIDAGIKRLFYETELTKYGK
ncbi:MAG: hypothetical protein KKD38_08640 [Candidatus Delongbacteria bacterium]|nr:hypothetical protein [Candidatus Delongbacteria bacterium]MCG2760846.1 hypothetical protein [Candidatus Delongbacteria bacterium]